MMLIFYTRRRKKVEKHTLSSSEMKLHSLFTLQFLWRNSGFLENFFPLVFVALILRKLPLFCFLRVCAWHQEELNSSSRHSVMREAEQRLLQRLNEVHAVQIYQNVGNCDIMMLL
ncbi:hypothetical protein SRHO_G00101960 [Serrasalmus rhombeus]